MKLEMYGVKDRLTGFTTPIPMTHDEVALRWFKELCETDTSVRVSPNDYTLYHMGTFDTKTGEYTNDIKEVVRSGKV